MYRIRFVSQVTRIFFGMFVVCGCVSKPPVSELLDDSEVVSVGTPGSIAFSERKTIDTNGEDSDSGMEDVAGCTHDDQCKGERLCIAGTCVSPQYAAEYEAKIMAAAGLKAGDSSGTGGIIEVLLPPTSKTKLLCTPKKVSKCLKKCNKGDLESCFSAGKIYEKTPDDPNATEYSLYAYGKACDGGHALSCIVLGSIYFSGTLVERNLGMAYSLNEDACALKSMYGCVNAAVFLENGVGVTPNPQMAAEFYASACIYGHDASCSKASPTDQ